MLQYLPMATVVLLLGGECTGKTALALALAEEVFEQRSITSNVIPEVLRDFAIRMDRLPFRHEQEGIWREQASLLDNSITHSPPGGLVICDPAPVMTAVYSIQYFDDYSLIDSAVADTDRGGLVVWCEPDVPWESDGFLRDGPQARQLTHDLIGAWVVPALAQSQVITVGGSLDERVAHVMQHLP